MPRNKNYSQKDTARLDRQRPHSEAKSRAKHTVRQAPFPDKRITVQLVLCDAGSTVLEAVDTRPDVLINAQHTVQQAVLAVYRLPGQSHAVTLHRVTGGVVHMWWPLPGGDRQFQEDWYPRIHDGDVVQIRILSDEDQEAHRGPGERKTQPDTAGPYPAEHSAAHTAGPHDQLCRCVSCSLAALLSLM
jgi:hypothetical protein